VSSLASSRIRQIALAFACSLIIHASFAFWWGGPSQTQSEATATTVRAVRIEEWRVATPAPLATPPALWKQIDRSTAKRIRITPADEQVVVLAARQGNGRASVAPHILRVEIRPGVVHDGQAMHIRVLTSFGTEGVYVRFILWEIGVPPVSTGRLPRTDADYPGRAYELFERDYRVPSIPPLYRGRS
jgi:hypothetical protein